MTTDKKVIEERLALLMNQNSGRLTKEIVLEDAEDPASPLHSLFEWDDTEAARKYRLSQANEIIRSIKVEVKTDKHTISVVRYVRDPATSSGYVETLRVRGHEEQARDVMRAEITRVVAALERAQDIADVLGLGEEVAHLVKQVSDLRRRVAA